MSVGTEWEMGAGWRRARVGDWDNCNRITIKNKKGFKEKNKGYQKYEP